MRRVSFRWAPGWNSRGSRLKVVLLQSARVLFLLAAGLSISVASPRAAIPGSIRLDDQLARASVKASNAPSGAQAADPIVWQNFFSSKDLTWTLARGRMGYRNGDLMLKGEGSTPVILSPKDPAIDWKLYEAVEIRMSAQSGSEIKIKIGDFEGKQKLGPAGQYNIYRFNVNVDAPKGSRPLGIMPTDSLTDLVAIHSIKLIPKPGAYSNPSGQTTVGKQDEYRNAIYVHSPSELGFSVAVPPRARLHFGMGTTERDAPIRFQVSIDGRSGAFSQTVTDLDRWADGSVDLSDYAGRTIKLTLRTEADRAGAVGLWANPIVTTQNQKPRLNVVVYLIDTLRADHSSVYGYQRDTTPFLKQLAASGVVFEDCQAQATWTKASVASLMTSLYSFTHGIIQDADRIPDSAGTLAEQMRSAGYVTASIVANPFAGRATGLDRGFDYMLEYPIVLRNRTEQADRGTDSAALNKVIFPWLERHHDEPFFLYAHSTDPHAPYRPPAGYDDKWANPAETPEFDRNYAHFKTEREYGGGTVVNRDACERDHIDPDRYIKQSIDRYDGEILHNDHNLQLLVEKLKQEGVLNNTLLVIVSDHGEEFWDHGWTAHGHTLYQELTHCALVMWNPRLLPHARRVSEPVQLIDIMPTILDSTGAPRAKFMEGQTLLPLARGQAFLRRTPVMSSRFAHPGAQTNGPIRENRTDTFALIDPKWKLIYRDKARQVGIPRVELYDRAKDRQEAHNVAAQNPAEVERLMSKVGDWINAQNRLRVVLGHGGKSELDEQTVRQLRSLGYLGGAQ